MAVRIFNNRATFLLKAEDGEKLRIPPLGFTDVPEKFTGDITFKTAVRAGVIKVFTDTKEGDALEKQAHSPEAPPVQPEKKPKPRKPEKGDSD